MQAAGWATPPPPPLHRGPDGSLWHRFSFRTACVRACVCGLGGELLRWGRVQQYFIYQISEHHKSLPITMYHVLRKHSLEPAVHLGLDF